MHEGTLEDEDRDVEAQSTLIVLEASTSVHFGGSTRVQEEECVMYNHFL